MAAHDPALILLVPDAATAEQLQEHLGAFRPREPWQVTLRVSDHGIAQDCRAARQEYAGDVLALGALVRTCAEEIEALAAGADDAARLVEPSQQEVLLLLDRIVLRAKLRREAELLRIAYARADRLASLGTLVAGVGREINNPLSAILLTLSSARGSLSRIFGASKTLQERARAAEGMDAEEVKRIAAEVRDAGTQGDGLQILDELIAASEAIAGVTRDLRTFARPGDEEAPQLVDVNACVEQVLRLVAAELRGSRALIERDFQEPSPELVVPKGPLIQVLSNLLINAAHAVGEVGRPRQHVRIMTRADADAVAIRVADTGAGIEPEVMPRIFDPFFSTKAVQRGTGLGLSLSRSIAHELGGDLLVDSVRGEGATFVLLLPNPTAEQRARARLSAPVGALSEVSEPRPCLLLFDDDERVLRACARFLESRYRLIIARDGAEAADLLRAGSRPDAVLGELASPELAGPAFVAFVEKHQPWLAGRLAFVASSDAPSRLLRWAEGAAVPLLHKPLRAELLRVLLSQLLANAEDLSSEIA